MSDLIISECDECRKHSKRIQNKEHFFYCNERSVLLKCGTCGSLFRMTMMQLIVQNFLFFIGLIPVFMISIRGSFIIPYVKLALLVLVRRLSFVIPQTVMKWKEIPKENLRCRKYDVIYYTTIVANFGMMILLHCILKF